MKECEIDDSQGSKPGVRETAWRLENTHRAHGTREAKALPYFSVLFHSSRIFPCDFVFWTPIDIVIAPVLPTHTQPACWRALLCGRKKTLSSWSSESQLPKVRNDTDNMDRYGCFLHTRIAPTTDLSTSKQLKRGRKSRAAESYGEKTNERVYERA